MSFSEVLRGISNEVRGIRGAVIVGMDGIIVDEYSPGGEDLQSLGAEYGNILKNIQQVSESLQMGVTSELSVRTETSDIILRKINEEYFLALILSPGGGFGMGRYKARVAAGRLEKEF